MLKCTKCNTDKDPDEFYACGSSKGRKGYTYWCKRCYKDNYEANKERQLASNRRARIKRRYGLAVEEYDAIIARGCGICGEKAKTKIVMDHCHASGNVREALCNTCNSLLGMANDDPWVLRGAADYLERHASA